MTTAHHVLLGSSMILLTTIAHAVGTIVALKGLKWGTDWSVRTSIVRKGEVVLAGRSKPLCQEKSP